MFCGNCGKQVADGKKFCPYCGNSFEGADPAMTRKPIQPNPVKARKEKKEKKPFHLNKAMIITFVGGAALVVLIWGFFQIGEKTYGPETLADHYMNALAEDDWETIMSLTDVKSSDFLNKESLKGAISEVVTSDFDSFEVKLKNERGDTANVQVNYGSDGKNRNKLSLELDKQDEKGLLLFDTWKVSDDTFIVEDFAIYCPKGTDAYFDGVKLDEEYVKDGYVPDVDNAENYTQYSEDFKTYVLPEVYIGKHVAAALVGDDAIAAKELNISEETHEAVLSDISMTEKMQQALIDTAFLDLQKMTDAKVNAKPFDEIADIYLVTPDVKENLQNSYEYSLRDYYAYDQKDGIKDISLHDVSGSVQEFYLDNDGKLNAQVELDFLYDTNYVSTYWYTGEQKSTIRGDNKGSLYLTMQYDNGEWKAVETQLSYGL